MQCSCGSNLIKAGYLEVDDEQHQEKVLRLVYFCESCGSQLCEERPILNLHPTKEERASAAR